MRSARIAELLESLKLVVERQPVECSYVELGQCVVRRLLASGLVRALGTRSSPCRDQRKTRSVRPSVRVGRRRRDNVVSGSLDCQLPYVVAASEATSSSHLILILILILLVTAIRLLSITARAPLHARDLT